MPMSTRGMSFDVVSLYLATLSRLVVNPRLVRPGAAIGVSRRIFAFFEKYSKPRLTLMSNGSPSSKASITLVTSPDSIMMRGSVAFLGSSAHATVGKAKTLAPAKAALNPPTDQAGKVRMTTLRSDVSDATGGRLQVSTAHPSP